MEKQDLKFITAKLTKESHKILRLVAALTNEKQYQIVERLLKAELNKVEKRRKSQ
jgi:hypothetical protein